MNPPVSIILPTLNERAFIRDCLDGLLAQDYAGIDEILVVDGGSSDGTREIVASIGAPVRMVDNANVTAAAAMNVGLAEARNEVIVRADAHTLYATDYVRRCVEVLEETGAAVVGGPMRPIGISPFGRAVAAVTSSPVGVGPGRFHYSERRNGRLRIRSSTSGSASGADEFSSTRASDRCTSRGRRSRRWPGNITTTGCARRRRSPSIEHFRIGGRSSRRRWWQRQRAGRSVALCCDGGCGYRYLWSSMRPAPALRRLAWRAAPA
jgi:glycosyltransferase involved in cell wall biosynthesis